MDAEDLDTLDRRGYVVLEAVTHARPSLASSLASPNAFICIDGKTYWLKGNAQQGLVAELVAGRLAHKVSAGPLARIIRVTPEALPPGGGADHLVGVVVGLEDQAETMNARDLGRFISGGHFQPGVIDGASRARVIVFQTWLGVGDAQVLVHLTRGSVISIDHGDCFGATGGQTDPVVHVTEIPGVSSNVGKEIAPVRDGVARIEALTDRDILDAVSCIPTGDLWRSPAARRLEIARWLGYRRGRLREVMEAWLAS